jgi:hypothetical protein
MHNRVMIAILIVSFLLVATLPFWYGKITGSSAIKPILEPPSGGEKVCIETAAYMREYHTELLKQWRDSVVRDGIRTYRAKDGKEYTISLSNTCLRCHTDKQNATTTSR